MLNALRRRSLLTTERSGAANAPSVTGGVPDSTPGPAVTAAPGGAPVAAQGHLDRLDDGLLSGWFARVDGTALDEPVTVWCAGVAVARVERCDYRADLADAGIAGGQAAFTADLATALQEGATELDLALSTGPDQAPHVFLRRTMALDDHRPLNPNPFLHPEDEAGIDGWSIRHDPSVGVHVDDFPLPRELIRFGSRYTRVTLSHGHAEDNTLRLACALDANRELDGDLSVMLLIRADRDMRLSCALIGGGRSLARCEFDVTGSWALSARPIGAIDGAMSSGLAPIEFTMSMAHRGRGFVDIALCYVSRAPSVRYLERVMHARPITPLLEQASISATDGRGSFLRNGEFAAWSHGIRFETLRAGQELADGWFIKGRKTDLQRVAITMDSAVRRTATAEASQSAPRFGLRVVTGEFDGWVHLVAGIDRAALHETGLVLELSLHALGRGALAQLRRVLVTVRRGGQESTALVIARATRVREHAQLSLAIDERAMVELRRACAADVQQLLLSLEIESGNDVFVESIDLRPATTSSAPRATNEAVGPSGKPADFEDPNVIRQLSMIKGLEGWLPGQACTDAELVVRTSDPARAGETDDTLAVRAADIRRPYAGYPGVDIIVPVYNALESVQACVRSVIEHTSVPYTLTLIDDGSQAETHDWMVRAAQRFPTVTLVTNEENLGYTKTVNRGLKLSNADAVCVLNSDCIVTPDWLPLMIDCLSQQENPGMVGPLSNAASYQSVPRIRDQSGAWCFNPLPDVETPATMAARVREHSSVGWPRVRVLNGFCQLISRLAIERIGYLDETAFPRGFGEENDYCARLVEAGFTLHVVDDAYVFHTKSQSFGHEQRKALSKEGSAALKRKHPTLDWKQITHEVEFAASIAQLRDRLAA